MACPSPHSGRRREALEETLALLGSPNGHFAVAGDITQPADRRRLIDRIASEWGALDLLINNAGIMEGGPLGDFDDEALARMFNTNVVGPMALTRDLMPLLAKRPTVTRRQYRVDLRRYSLPAVRCLLGLQVRLAGVFHRASSRVEREGHQRDLRRAPRHENRHPRARRTPDVEGPGPTHPSGSRRRSGEESRMARRPSTRPVRKGSLSSSSAYSRA